MSQLLPGCRGHALGARLGCNSRTRCVVARRPLRLRTVASGMGTASWSVAPGQWLGPRRRSSLQEGSADPEAKPRYGLELTADQWQLQGEFDPLGLGPQYLQADADLRSRPTPQSQKAKEEGGVGNFFKGDLPKKLAIMLGIIVFSRLGVYERIPGVDVERFSASMQGGGLLGYIDTLSGGSISKVGVFSLGIVPYINASIILQLLATAFPSLKKLQREEGPQGRARFQLYQKLAALAFAFVQAFGQLSYISPYVTDFSAEWLAVNVLTLVAGAMILVYVADELTELKLGNGTSILITANIASALPTSVGAALTQANNSNQANLLIYAGAFILTTVGVVYVQEAERKIPMNYAQRYRSKALEKEAYLPFKVNATGVMPVIFSSSLLALPSAVARYANTPAVDWLALQLSPAGLLYLPVNVALIVFFNYYYTFLQLDPKDLSEQLKRQGASIPAIRPGRATADFITGTLERMSILGSAFLGVLAAAPTLVEGITKLQAFRGFAGTSVLILVGVATDTARKVRAEQAMQKYKDIDKLYDEL
ncbi:hypothetical protein WJX72_008805 [[Myrmecia] bisecta]|uniref:CpSecY n=1 Tax=[Myrmecia] bisecta TaxID=41462 RepID=A0AAW1QGD6_9CHLO